VKAVEIIDDSIMFSLLQFFIISIWPVKSRWLSCFIMKWD